MSLFKKYNNVSMLIFLVISVYCYAASAQAAKSSSKTVWEESFTYESAKKYSDAVRVLQPVLNASPKNEFVLIRLGWLNYLQAKYNVSFDYYKQALALNANSIDARLGLTLPLLAQQRWKEAAIYAKEVIAMSAWDYTANARLMVSESAQLQWNTLEQHASQLVNHYPTDPTAFIFLARSQAMQGKKNQAIASYSLALERAPNNLEALNYLKNTK